MTRIKDIAREAKVSVATVSAVFNEYKNIRVGEETKKRIIEIALKRGYSPHPVARHLARGKSGVIGMVLPREMEMDFDVLYDVFMGTGEAMMEKGYSLILLCSVQK